MPNVARQPRKTNRFAEAQKFNEKIRYIQGFRSTVTASSVTTVTITLNSVARWLLGITIMPVSALLTTLGDTQVSLIVNSNNLLLNVAANNLNPNFVGGAMIYYPTPQELFGNDSIQLSFTKNDAASPVVLYNFYYLPMIKNQ